MQNLTLRANDNSCRTTGPYSEVVYTIVRPDSNMVTAGKSDPGIHILCVRADHSRETFCLSEDPADGGYTEAYIEDGETRKTLKTLRLAKVLDGSHGVRVETREAV